ncbi:hypothetical protein FRC09_016942 [Ceratobasidium sp. 395]|nr:hypothetical protein FRC09_016942 [Ceratobasidium sp. 395]
MPQPAVQPPVEDGKSSHDASQRHRRLAERRDELLGYARRIPGFERFLLPPTAQKLTALVQNGVVVIVNIHNERCDALVVRAGDHKISTVRLPRFSNQKAENARKELNLYLAGRGSHRWIEQVRPSPDFKPVLALLWYDIVEPVLNHLSITYNPSLEDLPHIIWCTTGPLSFLPLHAAGDYSHPNTVLHNLAISSYIPTISSLCHEKSLFDSCSGILAVGHESSVRGLSPLPGTKAELDQVEIHAKGTRFTRLDGEKAATNIVLQAMADHSWVHFACHGSQNAPEPMKSALHLHDKDLDLATIARTPLKNAQLAFLSACQTAAGDSALPDESIHLAAGLLMAGYPTVIATLWSISDKDAPLVAGKVYECLLENGIPDSRKAAKALHIAVKCLRESIGEDQFVRWVPYVHIGR